MNCKEIENILPLYPDDLLSAAEKQAVEEHLKTCPKCCKVLVYLQQTEKIARDLQEVEPPLWFKQKIMAQVREVADQKSFMQKWFYPLRIKIPVQIFATIVITVLAVYIYRAGEQEMKDVLLKTAPVVESQKEAASPPVKAQKENVFLAQRIKKRVRLKGGGSSDEKSVMYDVSQGGAGPSLNAEGKKTVDNKIVAENYAVVAGKKDAAIDRDGKSSGAILSAKQEAPAPASPVEQRGAEGIGASRKIMAYKAAATALPQPMMAAVKQRQTIISVYVKDINVAVTDVEKILGKYEAQNIAKQAAAGKTTITAELKSQLIKAMVEQLKTIGQVEEKGMPADSSGPDILITIEIMRSRIN
jgi:hypothetical protein